MLISMEELALDLAGHAGVLGGFLLGGYIVFKKYFGEKVKQWDAGVSQADTNRHAIDRHLATCELRDKRILDKLDTVCESLDEVKHSVVSHDRKLETLSGTVSEMVGREKERDRNRH